MFDARCDAEFKKPDIEATMATMSSTRMSPMIATCQILPGVKPTGRKVTIPFVVVVGFEGGKVAFERIYWDQTSLLVQLGLMDKAGLPVSGAAQAARLFDRSLSSNTLIPED